MAVKWRFTSKSKDNIFFTESKSKVTNTILTLKQWKMCATENMQPIYVQYMDEQFEDPDM